MGKILAVHSYKGGTGKTLLSLNLAASFAKKGRKTCLFDLDFRAPSLATLLKIEKLNYWLNDYLNGTCEVDKILINISDQIREKEKLYGAFANPSTEAIRDMSAKDRKWEMRALGRLLALKSALLENQNFDYIIFDTSPGLQYSSINAIVAADLVLVATTSDRSDVDGTGRMLRELYDLFEKKTEVVLNKVLVDPSKVKASEMQAKVKELYNSPLLSIIPCFCDVLKAEGSIIFPEDRPDHPLAKILSNIVNDIDKM